MARPSQIHPQARQVIRGVEGFFSPKNHLPPLRIPIMKNYLIEQLDEVPGTPCPCGTARRAFCVPENPIASIHLVEISKEARTHYHKKMTEIYLVLEGEGHIELDGERLPVKPMTSILIKPGCRHRAIGDLRIINIPIPTFDPEDEYFDS
jgi:quercetin dioxygenase-like cupin family protein